jgi:hypothetical protein
MPVPFGIGVDDFIAVGSLIAKIATELQKMNLLAHLFYIPMTNAPCYKMEKRRLPSHDGISIEGSHFTLLRHQGTQIRQTVIRK